MTEVEETNTDVEKANVTNFIIITIVIIIIIIVVIIVEENHMEIEGEGISIMSLEKGGQGILCLFLSDCFMLSVVNCPTINTFIAVIIHNQASLYDLFII